MLILGAIVLVSSLLSIFMLTRGQSWSDDFASYVMQAKSILTWQMSDFTRHNAYSIENSSYPQGPVSYPWGFPLLLAPVYALFGLNPLALKLVSVAFYAVFLAAFAILARTRLSRADSLLLTGVFGVLPALLVANDLILSDIPFLSFSTISLVLIERLPRGKVIGLGCGAAIFGAFFLRSNGILLLAPLAVHLLVIDWPRWQAALKNAILPVLTFILLAVIQSFVFPGGQESYFSHFSMFTFQGLMFNLLYYLWLPSWTFTDLPGDVLFYPVLAFFALFSLYRHFWRDAALLVYCLLTVGLFIAWPERQGLRFIYPVLPVLFIAAAEGMQLFIMRVKMHWQPLLQIAVRLFWGIVLLLGFSASVMAAFSNMSGGRAVNGPFDAVSAEVFAYIREKTPPQSIFIFMRPRALRLFTERDTFMTENCADLSKGDYVLIHKKMADNGQIPPEKVVSCNPGLNLTKVFDNQRFTLYKITR
jgi:hypothetical protein